MTSLATPHARSQQQPRARRLGTMAARVVGPLALALSVVLGATAVTQPADAGQRICGERDQILAQLKQKHREEPRALGLSADGGVLEVLVSPGGGWTILVTYPKRPTCVLAVGKAWQTLQLAGHPA
jgi:hypothetical protein